MNMRNSRKQNIMKRKNPKDRKDVGMGPTSDRNALRKVLSEINFPKTFLNRRNP